jgi:hypothetical protein
LQIKLGKENAATAFLLRGSWLARWCRVAAPAFSHAGSAANLQHDLVFARLEDARRDDGLERTGRFVLADFRTIDEGIGSAGNAVPAQDGKGLSLSGSDIAVPSCPRA